MLSAALALFSEKGYHNVTMQEIAAEAEFAIGTLYKFFKNKEDLYKALVLETSDTFHRTLVQIIDKPGDELEKLRNYVWTKGELFRKNLAFIRLYLAENRGAGYDIGAGLSDEVRKRYYLFLDKLAAVIAGGIRRKRFEDIADPHNLAVALDSTVNAFLLMWVNAPETHPFPEDPDAILNIFLKGLIRS